MRQPLWMDCIDTAVDHVLARLPQTIVMAIPLGVGKPNPFVNALYRRVRADPDRRLRIITALSLEKPVGHSELERHFLAPLVDRVFGDYPDMDYVRDLRSGQLPANIQVHEFFMKTGDYLGNALAQQNFIATNYTFAARDMALQGLNLVAQAVASRGEGPLQRLSLSSNPDLTQEVRDCVQALGQTVLTVAMVNQALPYMPNGAELEPGFFDLVVTDPTGTHDVFAPPNNKVSLADYAIGLHASSLVGDGGTLQIGIGSLGDAIGQSLLLREQQNAAYRDMLGALCTDGLARRELGEFAQGVYGCSEMFVNAFLRLIDAGIIRREVYDDAVLQRLLNDGHIQAQAVGIDAVQALLQAGRIRSPLDDGDLEFLIHFGILRPDVRRQGARLHCAAADCANDLHDPDSLAAIARHMLGQRLRHGRFMTGGFFLGPRDFYQRLRDLPEPVLSRIDMRRIDFINQLYGDEALKRAQRRGARFMNTTMMVTLLGAAVSDALESGQVVSGVGGQYNFVSMSHALPDARLVMMLRATHDNRDGLTSSIVWNYGNVTVPRHLRDVVVTEYGVAELRGQPDNEVIKRLLAIADSRFQAELIAQAKVHGKLEDDYQLPERYRQNLPETLAARLKPWAGHLPDFPFGTDLTDDELHMVRAMKKLKHASRHPAELLGMALKSLWESKQAPPAYLERLGLAQVHSFKDRMIRRLFVNNL